jgi:hypothetical protein
LDIVLVLIVVIGCAGLLQQVLPVIRKHVEIYQMAHHMIALDEERGLLGAENERLHVELEYRRRQVNVEEYAAQRLGMRPIMASQILIVGEEQ